MGRLTPDQPGAPDGDPFCHQVELSMDDIETILNTLIYDGKVEMTIIAAKEGTVGCVDGQMKLYRGVNPIIQSTGLVKAPCGLCPVRSFAL